jgi:hypothetical protein
MTSRRELCRTRPAAHNLFRGAAAALLLCMVTHCAPLPRADVNAVRPDRYWDPALAGDPISGQRFYAALMQEGGGTPRFLFARSAAPGADWELSAPAPFGTGSRGRRRPQLLVGGNAALYVLWEDGRSGPVDVYFNRSRDGGRTWLADQRINTNPPGLSHVASPVFVADARDGICAVWRDDRDGFDAFYANSSRDAGATWGSRDVRITGLGLGRKLAPHIAADANGNVYIAWIEWRDGAARAFCNASRDAGEHWLISDVQLPTREAALAIDIAAFDDGSVVALWIERGSHGQQVYWSRSSNGGDFWEPSRPLVASGVFPEASAPSLQTGDRDHAYAAWTSTSADGSSCVVAAVSDDRGATFRTSVTPMGGPSPPRTVQDAHQLHPPVRIATDRSGNLYLAWTEIRANAYRPGFARLSDFGRVAARLMAAPELDSYVLTTPEPPQIAADELGHVTLFWSDGPALHVATSAFYGDAGWRHEQF